MLVWIFWSANILFFGAEFTQVYARAHGSMSVAAGFSPPENGGLKAAAPQAVRVAGGSPLGTLIKLLVGALGGLIVGIFAAVVTGVVIAIKSVKKLVSAAIH